MCYSWLCSQKDFGLWSIFWRWSSGKYLFLYELLSRWISYWIYSMIAVIFPICFYLMCLAAMEWVYFLICFIAVLNPSMCWDRVMLLACLGVLPETTTELPSLICKGTQKPCCIPTFLLRYSDLKDTLALPHCLYLFSI